jgi:hypothetical protein
MFLSYSHADSEFARKLSADLQAQGVITWLDRAEIHPGEYWEKAIERAITESFYLLVLLSRESLRSTWIMKEVDIALANGTGRIIPVVLDRTITSLIPIKLASIQWLDLSDPNDYNKNLKLFVAEALGNIGPAAASAIPSLTEALLDADMDVRERAAEALGKIGPAAVLAIPSLTAALRDPDKEVRGAAVEALGKIGTATADLGRERIPENTPTLSSSGTLSDIIDIKDLAKRVAKELAPLINPTHSTTSRTASQPNTSADMQNNLVFVIMSFSPDMESVFEGIAAAAQTAGFQAKRVKDIVGDYRITSRIIELITTSCVVVVDLTHERPNVYFELGYARGLGKTIVTTAREGTQIHFDVKDWTCTFYSDSRILERSLKERFSIERDLISGIGARRQ